MAATQPRSWSHIANFNSNVAEVLRLLEIHEELTGTGPGRRSQVEILNKSGIVLLVACWEAYVEDLAEIAFEFLFARAKSPDAFPAKVLTLASRELREAADQRRVWELAGDGWRTVLERHHTAVLQANIGTLNTPKPEQIDALFQQLLGLSSLSSAWTWHRTQSTKACARLTALVNLRGDIAHRVRSTRSVKKQDVSRAGVFLDRLAAASSNEVRRFLRSRTGEFPWPGAQADVEK
jgi:hypothetical protein